MFLIATTLVVVASGLRSTHAASASISNDRSRIKQLEQRISAEGDHVQELVTSYNHVAGQLQSINRQITSERAILLGDQRSERTAQRRLGRVAVDAYISASSGDAASLSSLTNSTSAANFSERQAYLNVASGQLDSEMTAVSIAEHRTTTAQATLGVRRAQAATTLAQVGSARQAAQAGIEHDESILHQVNGNLLALITAAAQRREQAEEQAAEELLAAKAAAAQRASGSSSTNASTTPGAPPPPAPVTPSPGGYANPLRAIGGLSPERIDQGVDYSGFGPIYALGDGEVLSTVNGGWPGGTFISYRLTNGPAAGLIVYAAEDIEPTVSIGEMVTPHTVLGQVYEGGSGIETGWASAESGLTLAAVNGQFSGANSTAYGYNFSQLLESLGAPGGILQNSPATGSLPANWPRW